MKKHNFGIRVDDWYTGPFELYRREDVRGVFYNLVENPGPGAEYKFRSGSPVYYTYSLNKGNLTLGCDALYAKRELWAASASGQRGGARPARPDDLQAAIEWCIAHYDSYRPRG